LAQHRAQRLACSQGRLGAVNLEGITALDGILVERLCRGKMNTPVCHDGE
jgi:hypothetical protein